VFFFDFEDLTQTDFFGLTQANFEANSADFSQLTQKFGNFKQKPSNFGLTGTKSCPNSAIFSITQPKSSSNSASICLKLPKNRRKKTLPITSFIIPTLVKFIVKISTSVPVKA